jgi:hypothetical protein
MLLLGVVQAQAAGDVSFGSYDLLATEILTGSAASVTFSSLGDYAADYQHLQIRGAIRTIRSGQTNSEASVRFNADTGSNYAHHFLRGTGSAVQSAAATSQTSISISDGTSSSTSTASSFSAVVLDILDPFETTKYTTTRHLFGNSATTYFGSGDIRLASGLWMNTASLTSITFMDRNATAYDIGSRFSLYGIRG